MALPPPVKLFPLHGLARAAHLGRYPAAGSPVAVTGLARWRYEIPLLFISVHIPLLTSFHTFAGAGLRYTF